METVRTCKECLAVHPYPSGFHKDPSRKDGYRTKCKECSNRQARAWRARNPERVRVHWLTAITKNPDRGRPSALRRHYGITVEQYDSLLLNQDGRCAICGKTVEENGQRLHVDHDHETGRVRGLLCNACNPGIGFFKHNPDLLKKAMGYLLSVAGWRP